MENRQNKTKSIATATATTTINSPVLPKKTIIEACKLAIEIGIEKDKSRITKGFSSKEILTIIKEEKLYIWTKNPKTPGNNKKNKSLFFL